MSKIAIIPARSGSKGLRDKNIKELNGKPLMAYSIECAMQSGKYERIFVSTDSQLYADIAKAYGADCSFLRSAETSTDRASTWDAVREVIKKFEEEGIFYDEISLLQVTSPLRNAEDIIRCLEIFEEKHADVVESVTEMEHSPLWANTLPDDGCMDDFFHREYSHLPRQALPKYFRENGAIYHLKRNVLEREDIEMFRQRCYAYIMPQDRSIDIDTELDFIIAGICMKKLTVTSACNRLDRNKLKR